MGDSSDLLLRLLTDEAVRQDPSGVYAELHERGPVQPGFPNTWIVVGHDEALEVMRNPKLGRHTADMPVGSMGSQNRSRDAREVTPSMLFLNPPDHTRVRTLVSRAFTPRRIQALSSEIDAIVDDEIARIEAEPGPHDLMAGLAFRLPAAVISRMVGVPDADHDLVRAWVQATTVFLELIPDEDELDAGLVAGAELREYVGDLVEEKRSAPGDDLLSALIEAESDGDRLSTEEVVSNTVLLYAAGFETTSNLIGNGVKALLEHPDQLERLRGDRSLVPTAVEEILRWDSPVALNARAALEPVEVLGLDLAYGETLVIPQGAGNRDPRVFTDPNHFDVGRDEAGVLSFGFGVHHCLGAALAREEGRLVFEALLDRFPCWEAAGPAPTYRPRMTLRGVDQLHVHFS